MLRGSSGLAGGGIYFAESERETQGKAHSHGVMIVANVKLGRSKHVPPNGDQSITHRSLIHEGYDSVMIPRPGGTEWVVYNYDQVEIIQHYNV
jgi:hypothetical protein